MFFWKYSCRIMLWKNVNVSLIYVRKNYVLKHEVAIVYFHYLFFWSSKSILNFILVLHDWLSTKHWFYFFTDYSRFSYYLKYLNDSDFSVNRHFQAWIINHCPKSDQMSLQWIFIFIVFYNFCVSVACPTTRNFSYTHNCHHKRNGPSMLEHSCKKHYF